MDYHQNSKYLFSNNRVIAMLLNNSNGLDIILTFIMLEAP